MEECEALCNKLAIMVDGRFVCIGASQELKQRFGTDYNIQIKMNAEKSKNQTEGIKQNMKKLLDCEVSDENMVSINFWVTLFYFYFEKITGVSPNTCNNNINNGKDN